MQRQIILILYPCKIAWMNTGYELQLSFSWFMIVFFFYLNVYSFIHSFIHSFTDIPFLPGSNPGASPKQQNDSV